jgi:hypothetical protein
VQGGRRRRWLRRLGIAFGIVVVLRLALALATPWLVRSALEGFDLYARYERSSLGILTGDLELWHLELFEPGGDKLVALEYCSADVAISELLTGDIVIRRLEVDGLDITLERAPDGSWPLLERFAGAGEGAEDEVGDDGDEAERGDAGEEPEGYDLSPPVRLDALRAQHVRATVIDRTVEPALELQVDVTLRLSDVGVEARPSRLHLVMAAAPLLDVLTVDARVEARPASLDARLRVRARGLRPQAAAPLLASLGVEAPARTFGFDLGLEANAEVTGQGQRALSATLALSDIACTADGRELVGLDRVTIRAPSISATRVEVQELALSGARVLLEGVDAVEGGELTAELRSLKVSGLTLDPEDPEVSPAFTAEAVVPGVVGGLRLTGRAKPFAARRTVAVQLEAEGITLDRLRPALTAAGVTPLLVSGTARLHADAAVEQRADGDLVLEASLSGLRYGDGGRELLALDALRARDVIVPAEGGLAIGEVRTEGGRVALRTTPGGATEALGLRFGAGGQGKPPAAGDPQAAGPVELAIADAGFAVRGLSVGGAGGAPAEPATWELTAGLPGIAASIRVDGELELADEQVTAGARLRASGITLARAKPWLEAAGVRSTLQDGELSLDLNALVRYSEGEPIQADAAVHGVALEDGGAELLGCDAVRVRGVSVGDARIAVGAVEVERPRASVRRAADGALYAAGLRIAGGTPAPTPSGEPGAAPGPQRRGAAQDEAGGGGNGGATAAAAPGPAGEAAPESPATSISFGSFRLAGAELAWTDEHIDPPVREAIALDAGVDAFELGGASPAPFYIRTRLAVAETQLDLQGDVRAGMDGGALRASLGVGGLRGGPLAGYLPPGLRSGFDGGAVTARLEAGAAAAADGGIGAELAVREVAVRPRAGGAPTLSWEALRVVVDRIAPDGGAIQLREVALEGLEADVVRSAQGALEVAGIVVGGAAGETPDGGGGAGAGAGAGEDAGLENDAAPSQAPGEEQRVGDAVTAESDPGPQPVAPAGPPQAGAQPLVAQGAPRLGLETLSVGLRRITYRDHASPEARPLVVRDLLLVNALPLLVGGDDPETNPPIEIELDGAIDPIVGRLGVTLTATPFAPEPGVRVAVDVGGIRGAGLAEAFPALAETIDASGLEDGRFAARAGVSLRVRRQHPLDPGLGQPFGGEAWLEGLALRDGEDGAVLVGVDEVRIDLKRFEPQTGNLHVSAVEVVRPQGIARKVGGGFEVAGLVLKAPSEQEAAAGGEAEGAAAAETGAEIHAGSDVPQETAVETGVEAAAGGADEAGGGSGPGAAGATPHVRVDALHVSGIAFELADVSVTPPARIPLNDLDFELLGFSTRGLEAGKPIRFHLTLKADEVELPVAGAPRLPAFDEITVSGRLAISPRPVGWVKASLSSLALANLKGPAAASGVELEGGTVDVGVDVRMTEDGMVEISTRTSLVDLDLSEAPDGPISRYLSLPAPLDTVVFILRDEAGAIVLPVSFELSEEGISAGEIARVATTTLGRLIGSAVAASPFRVVGTVTDLTGLTGDDAPAGDEDPLAFPFAAGASLLEAPPGDAMRSLAERLVGEPELSITLEHELGRRDLELARRRANPSRADAEALVERLDARQRAVSEERARQVARARGAMAAGLYDEATAARSRIRVLDRDLGLTARALDDVLALLRPGAERQAERRTREACLALGVLRLAAVRQELLRLIPADAADRVRIRRARFQEPQEPGAGRVLATPGRVVAAD